MEVRFLVLGLHVCSVEVDYEKGKVFFCRASVLMPFRWKVMRAAL